MKDKSNRMTKKRHENRTYTEQSAVSNNGLKEKQA